MSCKCGPNCLRRQGRRRECQTCNRSRAKSKAAKSGREVVSDGGRFVKFLGAGDSAANPDAREAGLAMGYTGGKLGVFMQGAANYRNGMPPPLRESAFSDGYKWAESQDEESHAAAD